jgi:hypothetical protein
VSGTTEASGASGASGAAGAAGAVGGRGGGRGGVLHERRRGHYGQGSDVEGSGEGSGKGSGRGAYGRGGVGMEERVGRRRGWGRG